MEIDISEWIPNWDTIRLSKNKALDEELYHDMIISFEDELVTLHCSSYQKDSRNMLLQLINIKGKHVTNKWGSGIQNQ